MEMEVRNGDGDCRERIGGGELRNGGGVLRWRSFVTYGDGVPRRSERRTEMEMEV